MHHSVACGILIPRASPYVGHSVACGILIPRASPYVGIQSQIRLQAVDLTPAADAWLIAYAHIISQLEICLNRSVVD